jgi:uncharacterized membrane protein
MAQPVRVDGGPPRGPNGVAGTMIWRAAMSRFEATIDVDVPVAVAYDQWTQFESFPQFMDGVEKVEQLDDKTLDWTARIAGKTTSWRAEITDQTPETRIAWKSVDGTEHGGAVLFEALGDGSTRIVLRIDAEPDNPIEAVGDALGFLERRVKADLERFKAFIEERRTPTGAWSGEIHGDRVSR